MVSLYLSIRSLVPVSSIPLDRTSTPLQRLQVTVFAASNGPSSDANTDKSSRRMVVLICPQPHICPQPISLRPTAAHFSRPGEALPYLMAFPYLTPGINQVYVVCCFSITKLG
jgi:hypothetical protein